MKSLFYSVIIVFCSLLYCCKPTTAAAEDRLSKAERKKGWLLRDRAQELNSHCGAPVYVRIFKEERELELWIKTRTGKFALFKTYRIAGMSGRLGPKLAEGDYQAPEGFYYVPKSQMNPRSNYHLSFNLGFPNIYDRSKDRTGSFLMVHGGRASAGCYAMTNTGIEEIYLLCNAALNSGQSFFRVHCFPFHMTHQRLNRERNNRWYPFWQNLKEGHDLFERTKKPPNAQVKQGRYSFTQ